MTCEDNKSFRADPRTRATLQVRLGGGDGATIPEGAMAVTRDVGPGGAYLRAENPFEPGTCLTLQIEAPGGKPPLTLQAEVKWRTPPDAAEPGMGVSFVAPTAESRQRLADLVQAGDLPILELYGDD